MNGFSQDRAKIAQKRYKKEMKALRKASRIKARRNKTIKSSPETPEVTQEPNVPVRDSGRTTLEIMRARNWTTNLARLAMYLYIASIYVLSYSESYGYLSRVCFFVLIGFTAIDVIANKVELRFDYPTVMIVLFVAYIFVTSLWVESDNEVGETLNTIFQLLILYFVIKINVRSFSDVKLLINAVIFGTMTMCFYTVFYYGIPHIAQQIAIGHRIGQEINQVNGMGMYCAIMITMMVYMIFYEKKYFYFLFMPLAIFIQLGCGSRKGFVLLFIGVLIVAFFRVPGNNKKLMFLIGALGVAAGALYIVYMLAESNYFFYRILQMLALADKNVTQTDDSIIVRERMIEYGWKLFWERPLRGYGPKQFEYFYSLKYGSRRPPHNTFIQILVTTGIPGFTMYYSIYVYFFFNLIRTLKSKIRYASLIFAIAVMMLANDYGANMLTHKYTYIFLAFIAMFILISRRLIVEGYTDEELK